jgi:hypothetical protein
MTRTEILARYRRLRQISKEHHHAVLEHVAVDAVRDCAKRLGLETDGRSIICGSMNETLLVEDAVTYLSKPGRSSPIDRYARSARFAPGSDEAIMLDVMRNSRFSFWRVERRHEAAGLILRDILREEEIWLVDENMEQSLRPGVEMAARLVKPEGFAMSARIIVPIVPELAADILARTSALMDAPGSVLASDPRLVIATYRAAVATGIMDAVGMMN